MVDLLHRNCGFDIAPWQLALRLMEWKLMPLMVGDALAGVVMRRGAEVHVAIEPEYRSRFWRGELRRILGEVIEECGQITTTTQADDAGQNAFVQRLGFIEDEREGDLIHYRMTVVPYTTKLKGK